MAEPRRQAERPSQEFGEDMGDGVTTAGPAPDGPMAERDPDLATAAAGAGETAPQAAAPAGGGDAGTAASAAMTMADGVREIAAAWAHYAEAVMRHSAQAGQALLRCRSWNEVVSVQAGLLRDNMHAFLDQSARLAEIGSRIATQPLAALAEAGGRPG